MGGAGSGRPAEKQTVNGYKNLDINRFVSQGSMKKGCYITGFSSWTRNGEPNGSIGFESRLDLTPAYIRLYYTHTGRHEDIQEDIDYKVYLTTTPVYFGGNRFWFICSGQNCGRRVGKL